MNKGAGCEIQRSSCEIKVMTSEEQSGESQSTARSYDCTFCKRGFTNAQALGGHMNIHRKEKAKLKQSTSVSPSLSSNEMVVDTPMMIPTPARMPWAVLPSTAAEGHGQSGGGENTTSMLEETLNGKVRQLPLLVEKPLNVDQKFEINHQVLLSEVVSDQKIGASTFRHGSTVSELDLEIRLGPEPSSSTPSSAPTSSTRHFF